MGLWNGSACEKLRRNLVRQTALIEGRARAKMKLTFQTLANNQSVSAKLLKYSHLILLSGVAWCLNDEPVETLIWNTLQSRQLRSCFGVFH